MANISIKKDFVDGEKLFAQQLNNNFDTIQKGVNAGNKIIWKDDNGAEIQSFRGTTAEVAERPIIDGQTLYNIETGETALDYGDKRISTGAGNVVYIGDEEPTNDATKIWISNDNIEGLSSEVAIGPEEPTTGEELWIQKGKNLFNKDEGVVAGQFISDDGSLGTDSGLFYTENYIPCVPNTAYTISSSVAQIFRIAEYDSNKRFISRNYNVHNRTSYTIITTKDTKFLRFSANLDATSNIQLEQGDKTSYEPYTPKKIHTKNKNGVYEEFYNEEEHKHTTILFKGSTTAATISLMDDYKNYEEIEVVTYLQGTHNTHKCHTDYSTINLTDIQSSGDKWQQIRTGRGTFSGKTLTIDKVIGINVNMENYSIQSYSPSLEVKKVVGINKKNN